MTECNAIIRLIDEADRPEGLPVEAENHIASCAACHTFADERASLRNLIATSARVQVPANFDALLRQRLEARPPAGAFAWFSYPVMARMGAAAAAAVVVVFVAKFALMSGGAEVPSQPADAPGDKQPMAAVPIPLPLSPAPESPVEIVTPTRPPSRMIASTQKSRRVKQSVPLDYGTAGFTEFDPHYIIVRGEKGDRRVSIPQVSVGAQPRLYSSPRRMQPEAVKASF